jgi:hypothetical protein
MSSAQDQPATGTARPPDAAGLVIIGALLSPRREWA